jgi:hypothetical protein
MMRPLPQREGCSCDDMTDDERHMVVSIGPPCPCLAVAPLLTWRGCRCHRAILVSEVTRAGVHVRRATSGELRRAMGVRR